MFGATTECDDWTNAEKMDAAHSFARGLWVVRVPGIGEPAPLEHRLEEYHSLDPEHPVTRFPQTHYGLVPGLIDWLKSLQRTSMGKGRFFRP